MTALGPDADLGAPPADRDRLIVVITSELQPGSSTRSIIMFRPVVAAAGLALFSSSVLTAEVTTFNDETAYQIALLRLGYATVNEGFEDDATWGAVRTTIVDGPMTAASVTSQGVRWAHNFPETPGNRITTGSGAAWTGNYGFRRTRSSSGRTTSRSA